MSPEAMERSAASTLSFVPEAADLVQQLLQIYRPGPCTCDCCWRYLRWATGTLATLTLHYHQP